MRKIRIEFCVVDNWIYAVHYHNEKEHTTYSWFPASGNIFYSDWNDPLNQAYKIGVVKVAGL